jgi:hypothetical protein
MLNHKYLISAFSNGGHPLRRLLEVLSRLNSTKMVREFDMVGNYDFEPVCSVYDYPLEALLHVPSVNNVVEQKLTSVGPQLVASATSGFKSSLIFFTDGLKGGVGTGVYHSGGLESSFRLREPSGVITSEMSVIFGFDADKVSLFW